MSDAEALRAQILTKTGAAPAAPAPQGTEQPVLALRFLDFRRGIVATTLGVFPLNEDQMAATAKLALAAVEFALAQQIRANAEALGVPEFDKKMWAALQAGGATLPEPSPTRPGAREIVSQQEPEPTALLPVAEPDDEDLTPTRVNVGSFIKRAAKPQPPDPNQLALPL